MTEPMIARYILTLSSNADAVLLRVAGFTMLTASETAKKM